jgi:hypothetical protein
MSSLDDFVTDIAFEYFCDWVKTFDDSRLERMANLFSKCLNVPVEADKDTIIRIYNESDIDPFVDMDDDLFDELFNFTKDIALSREE